MQQLSGQDAMFVHAELEGMPQHIGGVSIFDQSTAPGGLVRFKDILALLQSRVHLSPIFRRKLVNVPLGLGQPYWVDDPHFDLEYHVRHIALASALYSGRAHPLPPAGPRQAPVGDVHH